MSLYHGTLVCPNHHDTGKRTHCTMCHQSQADVQCFQLSLHFHLCSTLLCALHVAGCWVNCSTGMYADDGTGLRSSLYSGERNSFTATLFMSQRITDSTCGSDSLCCFISYFRD